MEIVYWIMICIGVISLFGFLYFFNSRSYRQGSTAEENTKKVDEPEAIKHYTKKRDKLSGVEEEPEDNNNDDDGFPIATIFQLAIGALAIFMLFTTVVPALNIVTSGYNNTTNCHSTGDATGYQTQCDISSVITEGIGIAGQGMIKFIDVIVLLIVLGFILGIMIKLGNIFQ